MGIPPLQVPLASRFRKLAPMAERPGRATLSAQDRALGRVVVLKLAAAGTSDATALEVEAGWLGRLAHPGLVPLAGRVEDAVGFERGERVSGLVMPFVDGQALGATSLSRPLESRLGAFAALLDTVAYLHGSGVLHLDIKPGNVLWAARGVTLIDLGSARPTDARPGDAGGTLGFAAPEILRGEAAAPASDIYSLGALLYELLAGHPPHGAVPGEELRRAVLGGEVVPLSAWGQRLPDGLGSLVSAMLAPVAADRPDLATVSRGLADAGAPRPGAHGEPPLVERSLLSRQLHTVLRRPGVVVLTGPPGSGRRRLARATVARTPVPGLDLADLPDPRAALGRIASQHAAGVPLDPDDPGWSGAVEAALAQGTVPLGVVHLGRREDRPHERNAQLDRLVEALVRGGARVLWTAPGPLPGATEIKVGPLRGDELSELARWFGIPNDAARAALIRQTGSWAGLVVRSLRPAPPAPPDLPAALASALALLRALPDGIPGPFAAALDGARPLHRPELERRGLVHVDQQGDLHVGVRVEPVEVDPDLRALLLAELDRRGEEIDPTWAAVLAARLGDTARAARGLRDHREVRPERLGLARELIDRLAEAGLPDARSLQADLAMHEGDAARALEVLDGLPAPGLHDQLVRVRALRRLLRLEDAYALAQGLVGPEAPERAWLEYALTAVRMRDLDGAQRGIEGLERCAGGPSPLSRAIEIQVANLRLARGEPVPGLDGLIAWALAHTEDDAVSFDAASGLAVAARRTHRHAPALRLYELAARRAEEEGAFNATSGIMMNRALLLEEIGRVADARRGFEEAMLIASRAHQLPQQIQITYNLARLELRAGRLAAADRQIRDFDTLARGVDHAEIRLRGALNRAWYHLLNGAPGLARQVLEGSPDDGVQPDGRVQRQHLLAWAMLELGRPEDTLALLDAAGDVSGDLAFAPVARALRGRAHLAIGRAHLDAARSMLPHEFQAGMEPTVGEVLLAWGGEDADPLRFPQRREALGQAAVLLKGPLAGKAARLRERLLDGPGAALDEVVALTEAMHDPQAFPEALARLVRESLGAHRVLIMLRMPGLGHQLGFTELSGSQAAGIGREVMERIQKPDDVWIARDAFADPQLRESSQTVQTFELKSLLAVAIPRGQEAVGALYADDMYRTDRFNHEDVALLQRLARAVGRMIPLMRRQPMGELEDPVDVHGVLVADPQTRRRLEEGVRMLRAARESNILLTGPTGSGKSVLAHRLATEVLGLSGVEVVVLRKGDPQMLVTQLMGSRKGEFTGALDREGAIDRCLRERKVLFLDEVQNLEETGQQILLPLLDLPRSFGGLTAAATRLRRPLHVILGTNHDVRGERAFDVFRADLWYRMSRIHLHLPPLAERGEEVVYQYLARMLGARACPRPEEVLQTAALYRATHAAWPGNLRQLDAFADQVAHLYRTRERPIGLEDLDLLHSTALVEGVPEGADLAEGPGSASLDGLMVRHVMTALRRHDWVQKEAAAELGMNAPTLNKFLKRNGLLDEVRRRRRMDG